MPVHHLRTGALYCIVLASAIAGLIFGSELVRWLMAALLALGAVPLWRAMRHFFQSQFWKDVEKVIAASDEQPLEELPSARE